MSSLAFLLNAVRPNSLSACNVAPVFLDTAKTVQKTVALIREGAKNGADLVVFPESYIPVFPLWVRRRSTRMLLNLEKLTHAIGWDCSTDRQP